MKELKSSNYEIYIDGSSKNQKGGKESPGGYSFIVLKDKIIIKEQYGGFKNVTNNRMELIALLRAMQYTVENSLSKVTIISDSQYVIKSLQEGWLDNWINIKKDIDTRLNGDLWKQIDAIYSNDKLRFSLQWVKAHNNNIMNDRADFLAKKGTQLAQQVKSKIKNKPKSRRREANIKFQIAKQNQRAIGMTDTLHF